MEYSIMLSVRLSSCTIESTIPVVGAIVGSAAVATTHEKNGRLKSHTNEKIAHELCYRSRTNDP